MNSFEKAEHPIVFISYSWDNEEHKNWVLNLANKLCEDGVDVILDRYYLQPGKNVPFFIEDSLRKSKRIITVLTPNYKLKAEKRKGGVGQEFSLITNQLLQDVVQNDKVIPILKGGNSDESIPDFLKQYIYLDFLENEYFENNYITLLREIYKEPEISRPKLGKKPNFKSIVNAEKNISPNRLNEIMAISPSLISEYYEIRRQVAKKIYLLAPNIPISDIITLIHDPDLSIRLAGAISIKSMMESFQLDLGVNNDIENFVKKSLKSTSSYLRYRALDIVKSSPVLIENISDDILKIIGKEKNEAVLHSMKVILRKHEAIESKISSLSSNLISEIQNDIAKGKAKEALNKLEEYASSNNKELLKDIIIMKSNLSNIERNERLGLIPNSQSIQNKNKLNFGILSLLDELYVE